MTEKQITPTGRAHRLIVLGVTSLALLGTLSLFLLPTPKPGHAGATEFSAHRAKDLIDVFADEPHSVLDPDAHARTRDEMLGMIRQIGYEPLVRTQPYPDAEQHPFGWDAPRPGMNTENIVVKIPGASERTLMLTAHYDSATQRDPDSGWRHEPGVSSGAADDGYGVATILETLRAIRAEGKPLEHSLLVVLTDAEETGMQGAINEMLHHRDEYGDVELIYNLEARGTSGPAVMFETSQANQAVAGFFLDEVSAAFVTSMSTAMYRMMPNITDLTIYLREGFTGLNTAAVGDQQNYHSTTDHPDQVNLNTLQHYGEQTLSLTRAWVFSPELASMQAEGDLHFFTVWSGTTIRWPAAVSLVLGGVALLVAAVAVAVAVKKLGWGSVARSVWGLVWRIGLAAAVPQLILLALGVFGVPDRLFADGTMGYLHPWLYLFGVALGAVLIIRYLLRRRRGGLSRESTAALVLLLASGLVGCLLALPGGVYLFAIVLLALAPTLVFSGLARTLLAGVAAASTVLLFAPLTWLLGESLGSSMPAVPVVFAMLGLALWAQSFDCGPGAAPR